LGEAYAGVANTKTGADRTADLQKAIDAYNKAIEIKPDDPALRNNYGRLLAQAGKPQDAQAEMAKAAQLDPAGAGKYYYNLGAILTNSGQADAAADAFKKAMDTNYGPAFYQYALYLVGKASIDASGNVKPAEGTVEAFQKYLQVDPNGQFAGEAKAMIESLGAKVDTSYKNPNAPAETKKSTGKKK
jgi:Tfp pilus assembly protein PilF